MKLLVAVDLTPSSAAVLREARAWSQRLSAAVTLLHVADPDPDFIGYEPGPDTVRDAIAHKFRREQAELEKAADELRADGLEVTALLLQGPTAQTILNEAGKIEADAILMGTRAHGALRELLVGSTSKGVLHKADRPVLLVPPHDDPDA